MVYKYKYSDEVGKTTECERCGCITDDTYCSSCGEDIVKEEHHKGLLQFINENYVWGKDKYKDKRIVGSVMTEKEWEKWQMKYTMFLSQMKRDDEVTVHEVMSFRM